MSYQPTRPQPTHMNQRQLNPYDDVLYPSYPILYTHPDRLATVASIFGFAAAPVERCRVLELGCSDGGNLLGMAVTLPASEFVGIDLAGSAIARGKATIEALGLRNIVLRQADLLELAPDYGTFDYIIVHGLYSWVQPEVRDRILAICRGSLTPQGIAYVSYNTLPGCYARIMLREMMKFHNRQFQDSRQQIQQAIALTKLLANSRTDPEAYTHVLQEEYKRLSERAPYFIYHDELAEHFEPVYFHQFLEHASRHDLRFLGEAEFFEMQPEGLTPTARELLGKISDDLPLREQYLDFMRGRAFRRTLLCHRGAAIDPAPSPERIRPLLASCAAEPGSKAPDFSPDAKESFRSARGASITTTNPLARALLWYLLEVWPRRVPVEQLCEESEARARAKLGFVRAAGEDVLADLREFIFAMYSTGLIELHVHTPPFVSQVSTKPVASPLARWQAQNGQIVTTLYHRSLHLPEAVERGLVMLMDGTRDLETLKADLVSLLGTDGFPVTDSHGKPIEDKRAIQELVDQKLPPLLAALPRTGVLMA